MQCPGEWWLGLHRVGAEMEAVYVVGGDGVGAVVGGGSWERSGYVHGVGEPVFGERNGICGVSRRVEHVKMERRQAGEARGVAEGGRVVG